MATTERMRQQQSFADGVNKLRELTRLSIRAGAEHQAWRQRVAIQARAVYAPDWRERFDRCGADGRDAGALQLTGDLVAQRLRDIQVSVVHDGVVTLPCGEREASAPQELSGHCDCGPPRGHRRSAKRAVRLGGDEMALDVEGIVDGGVCGKKFLG